MEFKAGQVTRMVRVNALNLMGPSQRSVFTVANVIGPVQQVRSQPREYGHRKWVNEARECKDSEWSYRITSCIHSWEPDG
jgi:hypothetical protein